MSRFYDERAEQDESGISVTLWKYDAPEVIKDEAPIFTAGESFISEEQEGAVALNIMTEIASIIGYTELEQFGQHAEQNEDGIYCDDAESFRLHIYCNESLSERLFDLLTGADG